MSIRSFPSSSSFLRPPRLFSGSPRRFPCFPVFTRILFRLLRDPEGSFFPDSSGTFFSPSSDELKRGGRKRSIQLARGKLKNSLVSNNQDKLARSVLQKQINDSSAFSARSLDLSLDEKLKCLCLISPRGERIREGNMRTMTGEKTEGKRKRIGAKFGLDGR